MALRIPPEKEEVSSQVDPLQSPLVRGVGVSKFSKSGGGGTKATRRNVVYVCRILKEEIRGCWHYGCQHALLCSEMGYWKEWAVSSQWSEWKGYLPGAFANLARRYTKNLVKSLRKVGRIAKSNTVSDFRNRTGIAL